MADEKQWDREGRDCNAPEEIEAFVERAKEDFRRADAAGKKIALKRQQKWDREAAEARLAALEETAFLIGSETGRTINDLRHAFDLLKEQEVCLSEIDDCFEQLAVSSISELVTKYEAENQCLTDTLKEREVEIERLILYERESDHVQAMYRRWHDDRIEFYAEIQRLREELERAKADTERLD